MMTEAFELLDVQPQNWPRWHQGVTVNGVITSDRHLFIFVPQIAEAFAEIGQVRPGCFFVDGAAPVHYDRELRQHDSDYLNHCRNCQEVELQHGLAQFDTL